MSQTRKQRVMTVVLAGLAGVAVTLSARAAFDEPSQAPLTFSGRLTGVGNLTTQALTFAFTKGAETCTGNSVAELAPDGAFTTAITLAGGCPADFFSGGEQPTVSISVGATEVVTNQQIGAVPFARFANRADVAARVDEATCPAGYSLNDNGGVFECVNGLDVVVKVGTGASAFWMDRYENIILNDITNTPLTEPQVAVLDPAGRSDVPVLRAESRAGVTPTGNVTWMIANALCRQAGKRLPHRAEWLFAASRGLTDTDCNTSTNGVVATGTASCRSADGVQDLFGNLQEYMEEWAVGAASLADGATGATPFLIDSDEVFNLAGRIHHIGDALAQGMPAVEIRGGGFNIGDAGGLFFGGADRSPVNRIAQNGFRCVTPR